MTTEEQIVAIKNGDPVITTKGETTANINKVLAEKVEENKNEIPVEETAKESAAEDTPVTEPKALEETAAEPEITATTSSEDQFNFEPDVKLGADIPLIPIDGIDLGLGSTSTTAENDIPVAEVTTPVETNDVNMFNTPSMSSNFKMPKENFTQENQDFINNTQSFMNNDQAVKTTEPSVFEPQTSGESDKILEFIASTRKDEKREIVRHNTITTNPEAAAEVIDGFFDNFSFEEAKERSKEYVFNQTTALNITNGQLKKVHDEEPLHSSTREKNEVVFRLNQGEISTDEFPGFSNKFSKMDSETSFSDQQGKMVSFPDTSYGMQQADMYGNIIQGGFGDSEQNLNNEMDNSKPFAA